MHLNRMLSTEVAKAGLKVRINSIAPGVFPSEMTTQDSGEDQKSEMPKEHKEGLPSSRPGKESDIATAILFCVSCQYLNGQVSKLEDRRRDKANKIKTIPVDGGYIIQAGE